jgi:hypothetical protein
MAVAGDAGLWSDFFPGDLIPHILDLVLDAWAVFEKPEPTALEVPITRRFRSRLRQDKNLRKLPVRIERESPEDSLESGEEIGRIDLRFCHGYREEVYFAFECKRLNLVQGRKRRSMAAEYVEEGMMRFVEGRYAGGLLSGGMMGYVMDGNVPAAMRSVRRAVGSRRERLRLEGDELAECPLRPGHSQIRETVHRLERDLRIFHVFLPVRVPPAPG